MPGIDDGALTDHKFHPALPKRLALAALAARLAGVEAAAAVLREPVRIVYSAQT